MTPVFTDQETSFVWAATLKWSL